MSNFIEPKLMDLEQVQDIKTLVLRAAERWSEKVALVFDEFNETLTFSEIESKSNSIAGFLKGIGVEYGDHVAVMLKNRSEFYLTWLALAKLGAAMVPVNINYKEFDAHYIIDHSEAKVVVTSAEFISLIKVIRQNLKSQTTIICVDKVDEPEVLSYKDLVLSLSLRNDETTVFPETLVNIQYTSGTTGRPKGCMVSHSYWLSLVKQFTLQPPNLNENDVMLTAQPLYYMDPQWNMLTAIASGAKLVVLDRFHPSIFTEKIRSYNVTFFYCLGIMPTLLNKVPSSSLDRENKLRYVSCSAIPVELHRELEERWDAPWFETYGMTEAGGVTFALPKDHDRLVGSGSMGPIDRFKEALVLDENETPVLRGQVGELVIRGLGIMQGYFKDREATNEAFRGGWFHTGDLVRMDENGYLYYVGRKKEMIRRSGENVSAMEVEEVIKLHPKVQYVACVPVPDDIRGEEIKAYVVLKDEETKETVPPEVLIDFCSQKLAYFKVPRYLEYCQKLPLTPSERVAKHILVKEKGDLRLDSYDRVEKVWR